MTTGTNGGTHVAGQPLTTTITNEAAPDLLRRAIDSRITKIRPMATPIDQISRMAGCRQIGSMEVDYYLVDTKKFVTTLTDDAMISGADDYGNGAGKLIRINVNDASFFDKTDTVMFPSVTLNKYDCLTGYVVDVNGKQLSVVVDVKSGQIKTGAKVIRMGRAATELDVQTAQYQALPTKKTNYCQIFKMQFEQSSLMRIADKEVGWSFSEQEEAAVFDMRLGMERNFLFGRKFRFFDNVKNENIYLTEGIWSQAADEIPIDLKKLTVSDFIEIARKVFTGNNGSPTRLLIGGSEFVATISKIEADSRIVVGPMREKWGLETREISTNFGKFHLIYSEVFDQCGQTENAMVLDLASLTKYVHVPFHPEKLDLRSAGTRNTDAVVLTEASCLVLRNPNANFRIISLE